MVVLDIKTCLTGPRGLNDDEIVPCCSENGDDILKGFREVPVGNTGGQGPHEDRRGIDVVHADPVPEECGELPGIHGGGIDAQDGTAFRDPGIHGCLRFPVPVPVP